MLATPVERVRVASQGCVLFLQHPPSAGECRMNFRKPLDPLSFW